jgi:hypothetical protein
MAESASWVTMDGAWRCSVPGLWPSHCLRGTLTAPKVQRTLKLVLSSHRWPHPLPQVVHVQSTPHHCGQRDRGAAVGNMADEAE